MSKYIIDTGDYLFTTDGVLVVGFDCDNKPATFYNSLDNLEELNSDYINEHYGELQDEAYQAGMSDAWGVARSLVWDTSIVEYETAGVNVENWGDETCEVLRRYTAQEAAELFRKINLDDRIEVGDEVIDKDGDMTIVTNIHERLFDGLCSDGSAMSDLFLEDVRKTGRHFDIASILEAMRQ